MLPIALYYLNPERSSKDLLYGVTQGQRWSSLSRLILVEIRAVEKDDATALMDIYNREVLNSLVTLDLLPRTLELQQRWIAEHSGVHGAIVAVQDTTVIGFASLSPYRVRPGYSTTVEDSIYIHQDHRSKGVGKELLKALLELAGGHGFHACMARIVSTHLASIALHRSCGFQLVGIETEVGRKFGKWIDIALMQNML